MKIMVAALLFVALFLTSSFVQSTMADGPAADSSFCSGKCAARCANAGYKERCLKYCGICCSKCKCVPSGTYGHKEECACYSNLLNSKGKPKCP